ncbi:MAG: hypothetical protein M3Y64_05285 [Gemmatimonadota bacterium]|nr:hypothetical protein [Gemmatimonadota bacterium]
MRAVISFKNAFRVAAGALSILSFVACEKTTSATEPAGGTGVAAINTIVTTAPINASSIDTLVAFSLATNSIVPKSGDWDLLLRRYEIRLNSAATAGAASKNVTAYALSNNKNATNAQVLAFTPENTLAAFDSIRASSIPADNLFITDRLSEDKNSYLNLNGIPSANPANYWKVRTANGGYAVVHVTAITFSPQFALTSITFESRLQSTAGLSAAQAITIPTGAATIYYGAVTNSSVTPNGCNWDLQLNPNTFDMTTNTACSVGTYPGGSSPNFAAATSANSAAQYPLYLSVLFGPIANSVTDATAPFRYDLLGNQRLSPSFNSYLIKVGTKVYKLQVINYYSATGASGYPTLRAARIQ